MKTDTPKAIAEHYDIEATLAGGQSIVYKARDKKLNRLVAIKTPDERVLADPARLEKFIDEGRKLARLDDPCVLPVFHFYEQGDLDNSCYLITPWMEQSLQDVLDHEQLKPEAAIDILRKVLAGIRALHQAGIIHRDLKPANIYLSANGQQVKVGDLGIASDVGTDQTLSAADLTPKYHAPELFSLEGEIDRRSDIYSLGMIAYEMFVGRKKFEEVFSEIYKGTDEKTRSTRWLNWHQDRERVVPPLSETVPGVPQQVSDCVQRMLDKDPQRRFPDVDSVLSAMNAASAQDAAPAVPFKVLDVAGDDGKTPKGRSGLLRSKWTWIGAAVVVFWLAVLAVMLSGPSGDRAAALEAKTAMEAARQNAVDAGADKGAGRPAFAAGDEQSDLGFRLAEEDYDQARDAFVEAAARYRESITLTLDAGVQAARDLAAEARERAEQLDATKLDSFMEAQSIFDAAAGLHEDGKYDESVEAYADSGRRFGKVIEEAGAVKAWMETDAARQSAVQAGVPPQQQLFMAAREIHKSGADALKQEDYATAKEHFEKASRAYRDAEDAYRQTAANRSREPVRFTAGSTREQILDAIELCMKYRDECDPDWYTTETQREVELSPFAMDPHEVTNREFAQFVEQTGYQTEAERRGYSTIVVGAGSLPAPGLSWRTPRGSKSSYQDYPDHPVVHVSLADAAAFCEWSGKRLPTEDEWEFMARGTDERVFPWGDEWDASNLAWNTDGIDGPQKVGSFAPGSTPAAIHDLAGNVWEWTSSKEGALGVLKGGSWTDGNPANFRGAARRVEQPQSTAADDGFRCVEDVEEWRSNHF